MAVGGAGGAAEVVTWVTIDPTSVAKMTKQLAEIHAAPRWLWSGLSVREYAARVGVPPTTLSDRMRAAEVCTHMRTEVNPASWRSLAEIHAAPQWLWPALVGRPKCPDMGTPLIPATGARWPKG